ncbi:ATP-binding protein [Lichenicoccus sp.]|uniref:ATP-binding protein n=1 Tax=Lichenicoccus sp. TaxID=2781899 RepID=UPI003D0F2F7D
MSSGSDIADLVDACRARPTSAPLLRALLAEVARATDASPAAELLRDLAADAFDDPALRRAVSAFLFRAGEESAARRWARRGEPSSSDSGSVIDLGTRQAATPAKAEQALRFTDVGGLDEAKRQIHRRVLAPLQRPRLFRTFRRRTGGGVLLYGPPGCGKTLLARATAGEAGANFISVKIADILDAHIGVSEKRLVAAFAEARSRRPTVLFFDELEALASRRHHEGRDHKSLLVSTFLSTFDGLQGEDNGILVLAATNVPWAVDSAFRRPGRFDRTIFVAPPDRDARSTILQRLLTGRPIAKDIDLTRLTQATSGFSGADLEHLVETAIDLAIEDDLAGREATKLTRRHFDDALDEVKPTTLEWLATARNYAKYANEAGLYDDVLAFLDRHGR